MITDIKGTIGVFFCVNQGYVSRVEMTPDSGIRQGDPLSPTVFSVLTIFLIYLVRPRFPSIELLLYADDVLVYVPGRLRVAEKKPV